MNRFFRRLSLLLCVLLLLITAHGLVLNAEIKIVANSVLTAEQKNQKSQRRLNVTSVDMSLI